MSKEERRSTDDVWRRSHFELISAVLYRADPLGRIAQKSGDEYDSEARRIIKTLNRDASMRQLETLVYEAFVFEHGDAAGPKAGYRAASTALFKLLKEFGFQLEKNADVPSSQSS